MQTHTTRPDAFDVRTGKPRAIRLIIRSDTDYLTFADERSDSRASNTKTIYAIVGCAYGWLHNSAGEIRFFNSASAAYRAARNYVGF